MFRCGLGAGLLAVVGVGGLIVWLWTLVLPNLADDPVTWRVAAGMLGLWWVWAGWSYAGPGMLATWRGETM